MRWIEIEGHWINADMVAFVRPIHGKTRIYANAGHIDVGQAVEQVIAMLKAA